MFESPSNRLKVNKQSMERLDRSLGNNTKELSLDHGAVDYEPIQEICARFKTIAAAEQLDLFKLILPSQENDSTK